MRNRPMPTWIRDAAGIHYRGTPEYERHFDEGSDPLGEVVSRIRELEEKQSRLEAEFKTAAPVEERPPIEFEGLK